jgi:membrane peptidoglycan carboxypeptidase
MPRGRRIARRIGIAVTWLLAFFALMTTTLAIYVYKVANVPSPNQLDTNQTAIIYYADGTEMARVGAENRIIVPLSRVPAHVKWAVLAAEDRSFYSDPGVSIKGTVRAAVNDISGGSRQGGSGITQQYVKNAYLNADQTLSRKLKELAIALKLSREYSKDEILEYYLNTIYFGRDNLYGIEAAAEGYFGVPVEKLTVAQGALLAGMIKAPGYYEPTTNPSGAKERWTYVVDGMLSMRKITEQQRAALKFPAVTKQKSKGSVLDGSLGMVWDKVKQELPADGVELSTISTRGLRIYTTIDSKAQSAAENAISQTFTGLADFQKNLRPALTAVNPGSGAVLAYYGGSKHGNLDYAGNAARPPGSSFKPYTLAATLTQNIQGKKPAYALSSVYDGNYCRDIEATRVCNDPGDQGVSGFKTLAFAMKVSLNTTFDGLASEIGGKNVAAIAHAMGISKKRPDGSASLVDATGHTTFGIGIGDSDYRVRPLDQAVGFATIASGGVTHQPYFVQKVTDSKKALVYQHEDNGVRSLDPKVANDVAVSVKDVASWSGVPLANGRASGAKTGTAGIDLNPDGSKNQNGDNSDAWMVGFTPQVSASVWVGSGKSEPIYNGNHAPEYGSDLPGRTWKLFMDTYLDGQPNAPLPTTQQILEGSNIQPTVVPSTSKPSSSAPKTTAPPTTAPRTTAAPSTSAPSSTPPPRRTPTCTPRGLLGSTCPTPTSTPTPSTTP